jgi:hypothetical protein
MSGLLSSYDRRSCRRNRVPEERRVVADSVVGDNAEDTKSTKDHEEFVLFAAASSFPADDRTYPKPHKLSTRGCGGTGWLDGNEGTLRVFCLSNGS